MVRDDSRVRVTGSDLSEGHDCNAERGRRINVSRQSEEKRRSKKREEIGSAEKEGG